MTLYVVDGKEWTEYDRNDTLHTITIIRKESDGRVRMRVLREAEAPRYAQPQG